VEQAKQHILHKTLAEAAVELLVKMELDYQALMQQLVLTVTVVQVILVQVEQVVLQVDKMELLMTWAEVVVQEVEIPMVY
jgi:hypothetical protein